MAVLLGGAFLVLTAIPVTTRASTCTTTFDPTLNIPAAELIISSPGVYCFNPGTYNTQITVAANDVTLMTTPGTSPKAIIQPSVVLANAQDPAGWDGYENPIIYVTGNNVVVEGLTVDGSVGSEEFTNCGSTVAPILGFYIGIMYDGGSRGVVSDNTVENLYQASPSLYGCQSDSGIGIFVGEGASVVISGNDVLNYQKGGIACLNYSGLVSSDCEISGNVVDENSLATGPSGDAMNGIQMGPYATGSITYNTVEGNVCTLADCLSDNMITTAGPATGILTYISTGNVPITGNNLLGNDAGVFLYGDTGTVTVSGNAISGSTYVGVVVYDESQPVIGNGFSNEPWGIESVCDTSGLTVTTVARGNTFSGVTLPYTTESLPGCTAAVAAAATPSVSVVCTGPIVVGGVAQCTATVSGVSPTGTVTFGLTVPGIVSPPFSSYLECTLDLGSCSMSFVGETPGLTEVLASYGGDANNLAGFAAANLLVGQAAVSVPITSGSASASETATGVTVTISGSNAPTGTMASIASAEVGAALPISDSLQEGSNELVSPSYYEVQVIGTTSGTANVCISSSQVGPATVMDYYSGLWLSAGAESTSGSMTCGDIPMAALNAGAIIAIGTPQGLPSFIRAHLSDGVAVRLAIPF